MPCKSKRRQREQQRTGTALASSVALSISLVGLEMMAQHLPAVEQQLQAPAGGAPRAPRDTVHAGAGHGIGESDPPPTPASL